MQGHLFQTTALFTYEHIHHVSEESVTRQSIDTVHNPLKITLIDLLLSPPGFCLLDLTEQFSLPETSPPMLARLLEAIERKGKLDQGNSHSP